MFNPAETIPKRIPEYYIQATNEELEERIRAIKEEMGDRLFMPTHHYQKDEVAQFADVMGDSLQLARISRDNNSILPVCMHTCVCFSIFPSKHK